ncbi:MAG: nicotinate-nicotinamide nucleotide adenylyltransferase [Candidatus Gracilibacteria bacterium]|nr:nicotinate-nicotinamide nucleotide adenylyltransferase [Candidatus Gracilibacteria bacterium]
MENIAIYGGAFNPPTIGHFQVIKGVLEKGIVDKIIFSPDGQRKDKDYKISFEKRTRILEIFFEELKQRGLNVDFEKYFLKNPGNTTTIQVEQYFSNKLGFQPYHIFGVDTISTMPNRIGNTDKYIENKLKKIFIKRKGFLVPENIDMQNYMMLDLEILEISSTTVREMIKNKMRVEHILTPKVKDYIEENGLYI